MPLPRHILCALLSIFSDNAENHGVIYNLYLSNLFRCICASTIYIRMSWGFEALGLWVFFFPDMLSQEVRVGIKRQNQLFPLLKIPLWDSMKCSLQWMYQLIGQVRIKHNFFFASILPLFSPHQHKICHSQSFSLISSVTGASIPRGHLRILGTLAAPTPLNLLLCLVKFYS